MLLRHVRQSKLRNTQMRSTLLPCQPYRTLVCRGCNRPHPTGSLSRTMYCRRQQHLQCHVDRHTSASNGCCCSRLLCLCGLGPAVMLKTHLAVLLPLNHCSEHIPKLKTQSQPHTRYCCCCCYLDELNNGHLCGITPAQQRLGLDACVATLTVTKALCSSTAWHSTTQQRGGGMSA